MQKQTRALCRHVGSMEHFQGAEISEQYSPLPVLSHNKQQRELDQGIHRVSWRATLGDNMGGKEKRRRGETSTLAIPHVGLTAVISATK